MLFRTTVTSWLGVGRTRHVIDHRIGTPYVFDINNVSNLEAEGTGSKFRYLVSDTNRKTGYDEIHCTADPVTIRNEYEIAPFSNVLPLSIFPNDDITKTPFTTYIDIHDFCYAWAHNPYPQYSWLVYSAKGSLEKRVLVDTTLSELLQLDNQFDENNVQWFYFVDPLEEIHPTWFIQMSKCNTPTNLMLAHITGGIRISWTPNTVSDSIEIWGKTDSGVYSLLSTVASGTTFYDDILSPVDLRTYKIRATNGILHSIFTAEQSMAMLGAELIDQNAWYTVAYWNDVQSWVQSGNTLTVNALGGQTLQKNIMFTNTHIYRCAITVAIISGRIYDPHGLSVLTGYHTTTGTYISYYTAVDVNPVCYISASDNPNLSLISLSIKEILT